MWYKYLFISKLLFKFVVQKQNNMQTIIFKNEKKAKVYEILSAKEQGIYKAGELIRKVKTDNIEKLNENGQYQVIAKEIN